MSPALYFDNNATTPVAPEVVDAMLPFLRGSFGNPSSLHGLGTEAADAVAAARGAVARLLGARSPHEVLFTSGGTESIHTAIRTATARAPERRGLVTSAVEHAAVLAPLERLRDLRSFALTTVGVDGEGRLDTDAVLAAIDGDTALVSLQWVNNETGVVTPDEELRRIGDAAREHGALFHVDAMQAPGKLAFSVRDLPLDLVSISAHKFHGPKGVGALWARTGLDVEPLFVGGPQERDRRAGTENVPSIVGMGRAAELALAHVSDAVAVDRVRDLRDRLEGAIRAALPETLASGADAERVASTSNLAFPGVAGEALVTLLAERGVAASSGSACSSGKQGASHVLVAMGVPEDTALGALRLSLSRATTADEVDAAAEAVIETARLLRELSPLA